MMCLPPLSEQALQGRVPGLSISAVSGQPGTSARVLLRGVGSIAGNNDVLYVMDGVPIESGAFMALNPGDIESVTVLKDASAKAIYGSRGSNGVIVITTKRGKAGKLALEYEIAIWCVCPHFHEVQDDELCRKKTVRRRDRCGNRI